MFYAQVVFPVNTTITATVHKLEGLLGEK